MAYILINLFAVKGAHNIIFKGKAVAIDEDTGCQVCVEPVRLIEQIAEHRRGLGVGQIIVLVICDHGLSDLFTENGHIGNFKGILQEGIQCQICLGNDGGERGIVFFHQF